MESQDEASIETLLKYGLIYFVEDGWGHKNLSNSTSIGHISAILLNKYDNNWELLLQETPNIFNSLSNTLGEDERQYFIERGEIRIKFLILQIRDLNLKSLKN